MSGAVDRGGDARAAVDSREAHVIHASLIRPVLLAGAEPAVVIVESCVVFGLLFVVGLHLATVGLATFWLLVVHGLMVRVAKVEPLMTALYVRSLTGRDYYTAQARVHDSTRAPKPSIPVLA